MTHGDQEKPRVSIVISVFNKGDAIVEGLDRIFAGIRLPCETLVVYDDASDSTWYRFAFPPLTLKQLRVA